MNNKILVAAAVLVAGGCASMAPMPDVAKLTQDALHSSFRDKGIAKVSRLQQDEVQAACSSDRAPSNAELQHLQAQALASMHWPTGGVYLGDWKAGEKLAQNGRGMTWNDKSAEPAHNGGSCYNCHQLTKSEISFGTIGPSLYHYGKLRGVSDPYSPQSAPIVQYTWAKLWNAKAYGACSNMPRFGHEGILDEHQIRDLMALLLDPKSPVNQ